MLFSVGFFDFELTYAISTPVKLIKHVIAVSLKVSERRYIDIPLWNFRVVSYLPNIFKCLEADVLGGEAFFREKSSCLFHLL